MAPFPPAVISSDINDDYWRAWREQLPPLALFDSAWRRDLALVETLISQGENVHARDRKRKTILHSAAAGGSVEIVRHLLELGADVNAVAQDGAYRTAVNPFWSTGRIEQ